MTGKERTSAEPAEICRNGNRDESRDGVIQGAGEREIDALRSAGDNSGDTNDMRDEVLQGTGEREKRRGSARQLAELFWAFLKLGLFTIGGGYAMIPQMQQIAVDEHHWMTEEEVVDCIAVSQSLPGVIAINMATYIGRKLYGFRGAVCATIGVVVPSFVIISLIVLVLGAIRDNPWVNGAFLSVKAAVCGLILVSVIRLGKQTLRTPFHWVVMICSLLAVGVFGITAIWVILAAIIAGMLWSILRGKGTEQCAEQHAEQYVEQHTGQHAEQDEDLSGTSDAETNPVSGEMDREEADQ